MQLLWFELGALVLLLSVLIWRFRQRTKRLDQQERDLPAGHGFDTTHVQLRLNQVRQDYEVVAAQRVRKTPGHDLIVLAVRRSLKKLSYFRSAQVGHTADTEPGAPESSA